MREESGYGGGKVGKKNKGGRKKSNFVRYNCQGKLLLGSGKARVEKVVRDESQGSTHESIFNSFS